MIRRALLAATALGVATLLGCAKGEQANQTADSTARNLTLAPAESSAAVRDVPAPAAQPAVKAPTSAPTRKPAPVRPPVASPAKPVAPSELTLAAGSHLTLGADDTITTRSAKAGDAFTATVGEDVKDAAGRVVIPAGSTVSGTIAASNAAPSPNSTGHLTLAVTSVTVRGTSYPLDATVESADTVMKGRGVTTGEVEKTGAGVAIGALAGKLLGKNTKGAVIGGIVGGAAGAAVAAKTRSIDVVLPKGASIRLTLTKPL